MTKPKLKSGKTMCEGCTEVEITTDNMNAFQGMIVCPKCAKEMREYVQPPATSQGEVTIPPNIHDVTFWHSGGEWE